MAVTVELGEAGSALKTGSSGVTSPVVPIGTQESAVMRSSIATTLQSAPCLSCSIDLGGVQSARQTPVPHWPNTPANGDIAREVIEILGEIAEVSRAERRSAAELQEASLRAECEESQFLIERFRAEAAEKQHAEEAVALVTAELEEERQRSRTQRQAARRMRQRYERKMEEQAEELRRVVETSEYREQMQQATIQELERRLRESINAEEHCAAGASATTVRKSTGFEPPRLVLEASLAPPELEPAGALEVPLQDGVESTRRRLFSPSVVQDPSPRRCGSFLALANLTLQGWLFENSIEHSLSTGSLFATTTLEPLTETLTETLPDEADACGAQHPDTPQVARAASEPRDLHNAEAASQRRESPRKSLPRKVQETPPAGLVAEKVSIFERCCKTPVRGVPAALRRGPHSAPVPTPLGNSRVWRDDTRRLGPAARAVGQPSVIRSAGVQEEASMPGALPATEQDEASMQGKLPSTSEFEDFCGTTEAVPHERDEAHLCE
mmetsp:Transcript_35606/g.82701  ORF Transcript_35606/g.82701 Transcript_35606/m.82701 type:complete len:498 (-) Transcript_35606:109-1602(-)|eukprot:CAMPEP_0171068264 /NCGR_PEP_ID=MMETSP0766_2-20121228/8460_1 /TAXON_ID=439317 /ORGANISM="Gambierdiscus australes, Strain CAWD 149" /LENGTH=497 /DNA_ID=CAMNT_0011524559 /DNA_START=51 /DNA_END=1544 /DNA_ORIENTATION=+